MNKPALKRFATNARRELIERVELQARKIGITAEVIEKASIESSDAIFISGKQLSEKERTQRNKLIVRIRDIGFDRVMEEAAYTWFNRFTALRFMEVNDYLPTKVRVLSSVNAESAEPDMMKEAMSLDLDLDKEYIYELKLANNTEELFKYLIIKHCNDLNRFMPFMFETIDDYTEILFPAGLLGSDSFVYEMTNIEVLPESNWQKIEVIGWLYQYYIAEEKDRVFKAKKKYKAEEIPFATQLFTPDWIVRYMVQNSLGRYWVEANPEHQDLIDNWEFYLQNTEEGFEEKIAPFINKKLKVEEIKCFDPAMGSGHILVYMFDVLYEIYSKSGYMEREIPRLIIENNLFGLDIDDRANQLACFSVVMKALEYNKRFLRSIEREGLTLNLASIQETNILTEEDIQYLINGSTEKLEKTRIFIQQFQDAKTIGSLIKVAKSDIRHLQQRIEILKTAPVTDLFELEQREKALSLLPLLIKQAEIMSLEYDILVTNPPYMGSGSMNKELSDYLKKNYPDSKADLFAAFMEINHYLKRDGFYASINQHAWMFLSSYEKLRKSIVENKTIDSMLHLGPRAFEEIGGEVVQSTTFVLRNNSKKFKGGVYVRLIEEKTAVEKKKKALEAVQNSVVPYRYSFNQEMFKKIEGNPISYWVKESELNCFNNFTSIGEITEIKKGLDTGNNSAVLRRWYEINFKNLSLNSKILSDFETSQKKFVPFVKGGELKKWYGNREFVLAYDKNSRELMRSFKGHQHQNINYYFLPSLNFSALSSSNLGVRFNPPGSIFGAGGINIYTNNQELEGILAFLSSKVAIHFLNILNPTLNININDIQRIPFNINNDLILSISNENIKIAKSDWDSFETSWEFLKHPFLRFTNKNLESTFKDWENFSEREFYKLKLNEEKLNDILINLYKLEESSIPKITNEDITVRQPNLEKDVKSFISYAIGCIFGRYSLDKEGLIYAGGEYDPFEYHILKPIQDNILPIVPGIYVSEDIVQKFIDFIKVTFSEATLEENLKFIANAIGQKPNETSKEVLRRYFLNEFYNDHVRNYKKNSQIYWLFTSGEEKAFNCIIYMHRYDKTTLSRIRTDYLHEVQTRMDFEKKDLLNIIEGDSSTKEISNAKKELKSLDKKIDELKAYDEKLHHMADMQIEIDLDDGVAVNYAKFEGLVAKI